MKAIELIALLKQLPSDAEVVTEHSQISGKYFTIIEMHKITVTEDQCGDADYVDIYHDDEDSVSQESFKRVVYSI